MLMFVPCGGGRMSPVLHHSADYIFILVGVNGPFGFFENGFLLMYTLESVSSVANFIFAYGSFPIKPRLPFSVWSVFFISNDNLLDFYYIYFICRFRLSSWFFS